MLHDPKTVSGSDFDQETAEKIAPQFIARLELANCMYGMEIPARVISLWRWDQLGLDGGEDNLRSLLDPGRLIYILA